MIMNLFRPFPALGITLLLSAFSVLQASCGVREGKLEKPEVFSAMEAQATKPQTMTDTIMLGGGCFWCVEVQFQQLKGVLSVRSGYAGGKQPNPTYKEVCTGTTGHAEVIQVVYDPAIISTDEILSAFWQSHDPTQLNRQGNDVGTQYRSVIFYHNEAQRQLAEHYVRKLNDEKVYDKPVVTEIAPLTAFYEAEGYHQNYYNDNPSQGYCMFVIAPKLEKFKKVFHDRLK